MLQQLDRVDDIRREVTMRIPQKRKSELGQFMTPSPIARFMASLFPPSSLSNCRLLDAGAGLGALSCAFLDRWVEGEFGFETVDAFAYEIDKNLSGYLNKHLAEYDGVQAHVIEGDFIELANQPLLHAQGEYTHAILNPPYKKINSHSSHRHALRNVGIETVNLYSAFVAIAVAQAAQGGQIVAIIPRSFCNGPYYRPFRDFILRRAAIRHMHLFKSRSKAFKDDEVLQENLIVRLERGGQQGPVTISTSTDDTFADLETHQYQFDRIVLPGDIERFIHVPTTPDENLTEFPEQTLCSLEELGIQVSTGPVVDFRMRKYLRDLPEPGTVPLLYASHFGINGTEWPKLGTKKPNAIMHNEQTEKWLFPNGAYCVVRRFSSKEEPRRIVASVADGDSFGGAPMLGFENHLNVFHEGKHGMCKALANGLAAFLNTGAVDEAFRRFNGHTQVNATDLKTMKYPSREILVQVGQWLIRNRTGRQEVADGALEDMFT